MSGGLLALLDDVAALAKVAAASIDDATGMAAKASAKAAGIVIDDTAVTPRYVVGFAADRELPIVGKIAYGSLKNKLIFLLPAALILSAFAPWAITPLLMAGGVFLCFEGYVKAHEWLSGVKVEETAAAVTATSAKELEDVRVASAIRTDLILSAEIMAISLATVSDASFAMQAFALAVVAVLVTAAVYGLVAAIVKADDLGVRLVRRGTGFSKAVGSALVHGMPPLLNTLSIV
ncbi:MAG: DUF808 family protein, partial [Hyphomicrobiaceae bacterium]|nr:DUF808 family protein [Hyphomicrobiaceae bacterium]